jgi:soluble lytic murein transglycosylase-like protein
MSTRLILVCAAAVLCAWGAASSAEAQIYMLRQADGTIVLSDKPLGPGAKTFRVENASTNVRATRPTAASIRSSSYDDLIEEHAAKQNLRVDLVRAVIQVESGFNPRAFSNKGAMGLMQLMPATAKELGVRNPYDPTQNIRGGTAYLRQLLDKFNGDEALALAAYNAGAGAVTKYGEKIPPYRETREYVEKIRAHSSSGLNTAGGGAPIYKWTEVVDGREIPRYSNVKPKVAKYEIVHRTHAIIMPSGESADDDGTR